MAAVYRTAGHPDSYYRDVNVGGTERLLEAAARAGVRRFVHTSTVGVHGHVANPPAEGARTQAEDVVKFCEGKDPCNVVIIIGQKIYPFDNLRQEAYLSVLGAHPNIKVVATGEGNYDPDKSLTVMQDILQANKDVNVVLSNADQHLVGVEIALRNAGYNVPDLYLSGGGASSIWNNRSGASTASGFKRTAESSDHVATAAPMAQASAAMDATVVPNSLRSRRSANPSSVHGGAFMSPPFPSRSRAARRTASHDHPPDRRANHSLRVCPQMSMTISE